MSDAPAPTPAPQRPSVVIETNSKVAMPKWHIYTALGVVAALVVFTVVWFVANKEEDYTPGPWSQALLDAGEEQGFAFDFPNSELKCIDEAGARYDIDPEEFFAEGTDPLDTVDPFSEPDEAQTEFTVTMFDDCLSRASRVDLFAQSFRADSGEDGMDVTDEQAECVGAALDDTIVDAGGYRALMEDPENAMGIVFGLFSALEGCGIEMSDMMGMGG